MKMMNRLLALTLALLLCVLPALAESNPDEVLLTINGSEVTRGEYEECLMQLESIYSSYGYDVTDPNMAAVLQQLALDTAMEYELLNLAIVDNGLQLTDEEAADAAQEAREDFYAQVDQIVEQYGYYGWGDVSTEEGRAAVMVQVLSELEMMGYTEASYIAEAQRFAGYDKAYDWIVRDVTVSEEDVRARFDELVEADRVAYENDVAAYENLKQNNRYALMYGMTEYYTDLYYVPAGYRLVTHILLAADEEALAACAALKADAAATPEQIAEAEQAVIASVQPSLDEINARLEAGESFNDLIPEYTIDPGMNDAASIAAGYEVHPDSTAWVTPFRDAAFSVDNVGDVTAPVVTDYGVHILCYVADVPAGPVEYTEDVRALLEMELLEADQSAVYSQTVQGWLDAAQIEYTEAAQAILGDN